MSTLMFTVGNYATCVSQLKGKNKLLGKIILFLSVSRNCFQNKKNQTVQCCLISHKPMKGKMYCRPTLQSYCEGAFWFWPGSTLKTTTESKKSEIIRQCLSKCISTGVNYASYQFVQRQNWTKMCFYEKFVGFTSPSKTENIKFITKCKPRLRYNDLIAVW